MPTYQYRCQSCDTLTEAVQRFTDDPLTDCPECNGQLRKVYNAVGIVFKGSGFYATDSRSGGSKKTSTTTTAADSKPKPASTSTPAASTSTSSSTDKKSAK